MFWQFWVFRRKAYFFFLEFFGIVDFGSCWGWGFSLWARYFSCSYCYFNASTLFLCFDSVWLISSLSDSDSPISSWASCWFESNSFWAFSISCRKIVLSSFSFRSSSSNLIFFSSKSSSYVECSFSYWKTSLSSFWDSSLTFVPCLRSSFSFNLL